MDSPQIALAKCQSYSTLAVNKKHWMENYKDLQFYKLQIKLTHLSSNADFDTDSFSSSDKITLGGLLVGDFSILEGILTKLTSFVFSN